MEGVDNGSRCRFAVEPRVAVSARGHDGADRGVARLVVVMNDSDVRAVSREQRRIAERAAPSHRSDRSDVRLSDALLRRLAPMCEVLLDALGKRSDALFYAFNCTNYEHGVFRIGIGAVGHGAQPAARATSAGEYALQVLETRQVFSGRKIDAL
jgi:hypothetical protein